MTSSLPSFRLPAVCSRGGGRGRQLLVEGSASENRLQKVGLHSAQDACPPCRAPPLAFLALELSCGHPQGGPPASRLPPLPPRGPSRHSQGPPTSPPGPPCPSPQCPRARWTLASSTSRSGTGRCARCSGEAGWSVAAAGERVRKTEDMMVVVVVGRGWVGGWVGRGGRRASLPSQTTSSWKQINTHTHKAHRREGEATNPSRLFSCGRSSDPHAPTPTHPPSTWVG